MALSLNTGAKQINLSVSVRRDQAEKLLPAIEKLLQKNKVKLKDLTKIVVQNGHGSFTALRLGIATANALTFALQIPVEDEQGRAISKDGLVLVEPKYDKPVSVTVRNLESRI